MVLTMEQLVALGVDVVASFVNYKGNSVDGVWTSGGFEPAPGTELADVDAAAVKDAVKAYKAAQAAAATAAPATPAVA